MVDFSDYREGDIISPVNESGFDSWNDMVIMKLYNNKTADVKMKSGKIIDGFNLNPKYGVLFDIKGNIKTSDYESMSDFEINYAVARLRLDWDDINDTPSGKSGVAWGDGYNWYTYDPCNNDRDVYPMIEELKMTIKFMDPRWMVWAMGKGNVSKDCRHTNLKRAICIVYLMVKESEKTL